jgi:hypothetical protein
MRTLWLAVTLVAGCATTTPYHPPTIGKAAPLKSAAPRDTTEMVRTGQALERVQGVLPQDTAMSASTPHQYPVGPVREIPPSPIIP